ncbi:MAG: family protein phosphatase [Frankiaceae bacterium]|jgi:protein phosphatase|nr:family protein phosphatase [Frankiaceae bacterium]
MIELAWGALTHSGRLRRGNEDAHLAAPPVFVVADGMGGHAAGEVASQIAVEQFRAFTAGGPFAIADVARAISAANDAIIAASAANDGHTGMGSTVVGLVAIEQGGTPFWLAFNIGDSRLYRMWEGGLTQISVDHSYVQELVSSGRLSSAAAREHPERNIVTRALGHATDSEPDFWMMAPEAGERFLLCSDGLPGDVETARIHEILLEVDDPAEAAADLLAAALDAGGRDNITVVVVDVRRVHEGVLETTTPRGPIEHG